MNADTLVYSENEFGQIDGKVANGLARHSEKYKILGIIDSTKAGLDASEYLDGVKNGIPVFASMEEALQSLRSQFPITLSTASPPWPRFSIGPKETSFSAP
ncbi:hypothetical protein CO151_14625 [bacterium CG_4_9_14_3_um_filter_65_15]|nr:MAG: hypothetical protein CO151_14625 [bacterium CG_4_9_14_3_um_filter_65_15]